MKLYKLEYNYFENPANTYTKTRLRLDSLRELPVNQQAAAPPPYKFYYMMMAPMPERFTKNLDHWGFYNSSYTWNVTLVPRIRITPPVNPADSIIGGNANREPNAYATAFGVLDMIDYPTGGTTSYSYALHTALNQNGTTRTLGGLRIKQITHYALVDTIPGLVSGVPEMLAISKYYEYTDDINSNKPSGRSDETFPSYLVTSSYNNREQDTLSGDYLQSQTNYTVTANGYFGLGAFQGGHVGYLQVTEKILDWRLPFTRGRTLYRYMLSNINTTDDDATNGTLIWLDMYDNNGAFKYEVKSTYTSNTINTYSATQVKPVLTQTNEVLWCKTLDAAGHPQYTPYTVQNGLPPGCMDSSSYLTLLKVNTYGFKYQEKYLTMEVEKRPDYFTSFSLTTTTKYSYDNPAHIYPTLIDRFSNHIRLVTRKKYIADYSGPAGANDAGIPLMLSKHYLSAEVENYQYRAPNTGPERRIFNGTISYYGTDLLPVKQLGIETQLPITSFQESALTAGGLTFDPAYKPQVYFTYQNGALASRQPQGGAITRYLRGYNNSYTVAEMTGGNKVHAAYYNFEDNGQAWYGSQLTGYTINNTVAYSGQRSALIPAGGMITIPASSLRVVMKLSFWLYSGSIAVKQGAVTITPFITGPARNGWTYYEYRFDPADGSVQMLGNNTIIDELRYIYVNAGITTYTYDPLVGKTSSNTANNHTIFYEYDGLKRLLNIRDDNKNILKNFQYNYGPGIPIDISY